MTKRLEVGVLYGFRALMVFFVANFHFWQQSWLWQSVTLFGHTIDFDFFTRASYQFVDGMILLSGFLLFLPYARAQSENLPIPSTKQFFINRAVRILPSYWFGILVILFAYVLPNGYQTDYLPLDLFTHATFTFTFFKSTYLYSQLNVVFWTICIEVQFYLLFPFIAKWVMKKPKLTLSLMCIIAWAYRLIVAYRFDDLSMLINQMPSFLDVYAIGIIGAMVYCEGRKWVPSFSKWQKKLISVGALVLFVLMLMALCHLLKLQAVRSTDGTNALHIGQLMYRLPLVLVLMACMLSATLMPRAVRFLLDNRLMRFLSTISLNFYIWHQFLAVQMRIHWMPDSLQTTTSLQWAYTTLCYSVGILAAMIVTYGVEKPIANWIHSRLQKRKEILS